MEVYTVWIRRSLDHPVQKKIHRWKSIFDTCSTLRMKLLHGQPKMTSPIWRHINRLNEWRYSFVCTHMHVVYVCTPAHRPDDGGGGLLPVGLRSLKGRGVATLFAPNIVCVCHSVAGLPTLVTWLSPPDDMPVSRGVSHCGCRVKHR